MAVYRTAIYGQTALARKIDDAAEVARASGVSMGKAKAIAEAGQALGDAPEVCDAFEPCTTSQRLRILVTKVSSSRSTIRSDSARTQKAMADVVEGALGHTRPLVQSFTLGSPT